MKYLNKAGEVLLILGAAALGLLAYMVAVIVSLSPYALALYFFLWLFGAI